MRVFSLSLIGNTFEKIRSPERRAVRKIFPYSFFPLNHSETQKFVHFFESSFVYSFIQGIFSPNRTFRWICRLWKEDRFIYILQF
ncbi:hypothetical protein LEP1GSC061_3185 [Leptospira wolffii serovar Khorat str. Khorat-H2]|nr:hypothetical protein LEP1GSC061_3185 [Leptospira wolffii serovar Khorat str. Khorat-H2]